MKSRYSLRDAELLQKLMAHPGRGVPYSTRALAEAAGCHHSLVHRLVAGAQATCEMRTAHDIAEALGVAVLVLFAPSPSPDQNESSIEEDAPSEPGETS